MVLKYIKTIYANSLGFLNFEHIFLLALVFDFEQVNAHWGTVK